MKLAILSPFYPFRGGISQFSAMLYTELEKEGHTVKAFNFKRLYPDFLFPGKTQYVGEEDRAIPIRSERLLDSINPFTYATTAKAIKAFEPDVLIISYWMSFFVPGYAHVANRLKKHCQVITLLHNAIPHEPRFFDKPMAKLLFKQCDGFIVMSENVRDDLHQLRPGARYMLSPHPLYDHFGERIEREEACKRLQIQTDKKTLLFFGLIRDYKGLDLLIDAMDQLDDSYQLLIAGEVYGDFAKYQTQINHSKAAGRIYAFNQYINDDDIPAFFSAADALILPYRSATQSGVVSIAYHYNLPMLSTPVGDFQKSIGEPGTGIVTDEISSTAIAKGISTLFTAEKQAIYKVNIEKEKAALSWDTFTKKLLTFCEKNCSRSNYRYTQPL